MELEIEEDQNVGSGNGRRKVALVGAGRIGSTTAYSLVLSGLASEIVLIDYDSARAEGQAMDLDQAVPFGQPVSVRAGEYDDIAGALVTVVTAGQSLGIGEKRRDLLDNNWKVIQEVIPKVVKVNPDGLIIVMTDPVDPLTYGAWRLSGLPRGRVIGTGTILDTARFRSNLAHHFDVDARDIQAYVIGEHGDSFVPVWSRVSIGGMTLREFASAQGHRCDQDTLTGIEERTRTAAYEVIRRKGSTAFTVASALMRLLEAILRNQRSILPVSCALKGQYGLRDVALSLPAVIDRDGVREHLALSLDREEVEALHRSAAVVDEAIDQILE